MVITQMDLEIIAYANKRYNAGLTSSMIVTEKVGDETKTAFLCYTKKQADAVVKSMKTLNKKNGIVTKENTNLVFDSAFEEKVAIKEAELELAEYNITKQ